MKSNVPLEGPQDRPTRTGLRILVVDDDPDTADSMAILLRLYAYDVQVAKDGATALRALLEGQPDVVLLDIGLPKLDGWQLAREIRSRCNGKRPLLIAISGYGMPSDQVRSREAGIDLHLVKPVEPEVLQQVLRRFQTIITSSTKDCLAS
jgi:CheY-like chemotaxis protein